MQLSLNYIFVDISIVELQSKLKHSLIVLIKSIRSVVITNAREMITNARIDSNQRRRTSSSRSLSADIDGEHSGDSDRRWPLSVSVDSTRVSPKA